MGLIQKVFGLQSRKAKPLGVSARIDIADAKPDDRRHWASADALSLDGALSPTVRQTIRNRARYERLNNSYLAGISQTLASDLIGTGPRVQLSDNNSEDARQVEKAFYDWAVRINLADKLRTMRQAKLIDGESFAAMITNPALDGVQLDLRMIEADQVSTPLATIKEKASYEGSLVDGLEFDSVGNVTSYTVLRYHPGSNYHVSEIDFARIPAEQMFHWFTQIRPAQNRGLSEVAPCLRLFADLRRYTGAVIAAAETAADFAAFIHSNSPAAEVDEVEAFAAMEIEQRSLVTLPEGWNVSQLRAEQPTSTFGDFRRNIISEIGRSLQIPYAIAALDSSSHNYASARMDAQLYNKNTRVQRDEIERTILDRLFSNWLREAYLVGDISRQMESTKLDWSWQWDGQDHVDPVKEAKATETRLATNTTTLAAEYARQGKSWEQELNQRAVELKKLQELGLGAVEAPSSEGEQEEEPVEAQAVTADEGYKPPKAAQNEARKGLEWRKKFKRGGTAVGVARARDIANGKNLPIETIARIVSFFARHEKASKGAEGFRPGEKGFPSNGRIAWALWGGDPMKRSAEAIWKRHKAKK